MPVPGFQDITLPLLELAGDGEEHQLSEAITSLRSRLRLSDDEAGELLGSGRQTRFANRVGWAKTYLSKAGLLRSTGRGSFAITDGGKQVLSERPAKIDIPYLMRFDGIKEFRTHQSEAQASVPAIDAEASPEEVMSASFREHSAQLVDDLLERVRALDPLVFERLVLDVLVAMGYGGSRPDAARHLGKSGDGGVDGVINEDPLGLDVVYVQAKRWADNVSRPIVQAFAGSLDGVRAKKGVLITTSGFSKEAIDYANLIEKRIVLVDGRRLCELMALHNVGVTTTFTYEIKSVAPEYFEV